MADQYQTFQNLQKKRNSELNSLIGLMISSLIPAICFGVLTSSTKYYENEKCIKLLDWSQNYFYILILTFLGGFLLWLTLRFQNNWSEESENKICFNHCFSAYKGFVGLANFVILIGLCYTLDENEPCGALRTFILVLVIFYSVILGLICCFMSCGLIYWMYALMKNKQVAYSTRNTELHTHL